MNKLTESIAIKAPIERVFEVITDFERYPDFLDEMEATEVIKKGKRSTQARFTAKLAAPVRYTLDFKLKGPDRVDWSLVEGDFMEANDGSWELSSLEPNLTDATFTMEVKFPFWVPASMAEGTLKSGLPGMMQGFKREAERRASKGKGKSGGSTAKRVSRSRRP